MENIINILKKNTEKQLLESNFDKLLLNFYNYKLHKKRIKNLEKKNCRICMCSKEKKGNPLIHPCKCCGSLKWIHKECLLKWITTSNNYECPQCKYKYIIKKQTKYPILSKIYNYTYLLLLISLIISIIILTITIKYIFYRLNYCKKQDIFKIDIRFISISIRLFNILLLSSFIILCYSGNINITDAIWSHEMYSFNTTFYQYTLFKLCLNKIQELFKKKINKINEKKIYIENYN